MSDATSGEVIDTQEGLLGFDRKENPKPKKEVFLWTKQKKDFSIPEKHQGKRVVFDVTLEKNTDYDFSFEGGTIQFQTDATGASSRDALGLKMIMAVVPIGFLAFVIIIIGLLVGRNKKKP